MSSPSGHHCSDVRLTSASPSSCATWWSAVSAECPVTMPGEKAGSCGRGWFQNHTDMRLPMTEEGSRSVGGPVGGGWMDAMPRSNGAEALVYQSIVEATGFVLGLRSPRGRQGATAARGVCRRAVNAGCGRAR